MASLLLVVIYIAFISLGLPDSLLGSAWPVMHVEFGVPLSYAGIVTMIIAGCTIVASLSSNWLTKRLGAGWVAAISVTMTAGAMIGFSYVQNFSVLCVVAIPYGLGAGAIDAALNNYVALHYSSRHMNWLHCFWGVGAAISPYIMGYYLLNGSKWWQGYGTVGYIQLVIAAIMFATVFMWVKRTDNIKSNVDIKPKSMRIIDAVKIKGVKYVLLTFFCYCALESTAGLWATSYLTINRGISTSVASQFASLFYIGITLGRFVCGFIADKLGDKRLIRIGLAILTLGIIAIIIPFESNTICFVGLVTAGLGCAPIYPSVIHSTPYNFGKENSQAIIGVQMASAYLGSTFMPPLFGLIANNIDIKYYPYYLLIFAVLMIVLSEIVNKKLQHADPITQSN